MLGYSLKTKQTGPQGVPVRKLMIAESIDLKRELYFAILMVCFLICYNIYALESLLQLLIMIVLLTFQKMRHYYCSIKVGVNKIHVGPCCRWPNYDCQSTRWCWYWDCCREDTWSNLQRAYWYLHWPSSSTIGTIGNLSWLQGRSSSRCELQACMLY